MTCFERCPVCVTEILVPRTNGMGGAFLECTTCGYHEPVVRKADPFPTGYRRVARGNGFRLMPIGRNGQPSLLPRRRGMVIG